MSLDLNLLRIVKHKDDFLKIRGRVPKDGMSKQTYALLADFDKYFKQFPEHVSVDIDAFRTLFRAWHPKLTDEMRNNYDTLIATIKSDVDEPMQEAIMHAMLDLRLGNETALLLGRYEEGDVENLGAQFHRLMEEYKNDAKATNTGLDFLTDDIGDLLMQEINEDGLRWRLSCLNRSMRGLRGGDFGIVAGRPDRGKTTLATSEMSFMAPQLPHDRPLVWLNNEGPGNRIITRFWQSALGIPMSEMIRKHQMGHLKTEFNDAMGGVENRLRVFDIHGYDNYRVEQIIEKHNPGLVVFDMIDNIRGFGDSARKDLQLEHMYQSCRELAVKYDFAGVATSQISNEGDNMQFPPQGALKDSKTGKQGACDFIMMAGYVDDPGYVNTRFMSLPKNKLRREGKPGDPREPVRFQGDIARYSDVPVEE